MSLSSKASPRRQTSLSILFFSIVMFFLMPGENVEAKRGEDDNRLRFYGLIQARPMDSLHGEWVVGGRTVVTDDGTEFDQAEGTLNIGTCAKVDIRNGRIHEIDSEPLHNCP